MARICQNGQRIREEAAKVIYNSLNLKNYYHLFRPGTRIVNTGLFLVFGDNLLQRRAWMDKKKASAKPKGKKGK